MSDAVHCCHLFVVYYWEVLPMYSELYTPRVFVVGAGCLENPGGNLWFYMEGGLWIFGDDMGEIGTDENDFDG